MTEETWVKHPVAFKIEIRGVVSVEHPDDEDAVDYLTAYYCKGRYFMSDTSAAEALIRDAGNDNLEVVEVTIVADEPTFWAAQLAHESELAERRRAEEDEAQQFRDSPYGRD